MREIPICIEMDEEIENALASSGLTIQEILAKQGIGAKVEFGSPPYQDENTKRTKDVATIIMASAAAVWLISKAITDVLKEIHHRPVFREYEELEPVSDANGNPLLDPETGKPFMKRKKKFFVHEPGKAPGEEKSPG